MARCRWLSSPFAVALAALLAGCGSEPIDPGGGGSNGGGKVAAITVLAGADQAGTPGRFLPDSIVVRATDRDGNAVRGTELWFVSQWAADSTRSQTLRTDSTGRVAIAWMLGLAEGAQTLTINSITSSSVTAQVQASATALHATGIAVGRWGACATGTAQGTVCWGGNAGGELGNGGSLSEATGTPVPASVPAPLVRLEGSLAGTFCGQDAGGTTYCWGRNRAGETGTGLAASAVSTPTPIAGPARLVQVGVKGHFDGLACGVDAAGQGWCWGKNANGETGTGAVGGNIATPAPVAGPVKFAQIIPGTANACGLTTDGHAWCWGVQETGTGGLGPRPAGVYPEPVAVQPGHTFTSLAMGREWVCGLKASGEAFCWGVNSFLILGGLSIDTAIEPVPVNGNHRFRMILSAAAEAAVGLDYGGKLWTWGASSHTYDAGVNPPAPVAPELTFTAFDVGDSSGQLCGITTTGAVYCTQPYLLAPVGLAAVPALGTP